MNVEQLGVEDLKQLFDFGTKLGKEVSDDLADKKFTIQEGIGLIDNFMEVPDLLNKKDSILAQAKDLSLDEVDEIIAGAEGEFTKGDVVEIIHDALNWIVSTKNLIVRFGKKAA
ncbi:MAG TPA: hypothetical protein VIM07_15140 [Chitinophagaceae bacterium]